MKIIIGAFVGLFAGIIGAMGMGGGSVLILYLTLVADTARFKAQGINLLFFIPIATASVIIYINEKSIKPKAVIPLAIGGVIGALTGAFSGEYIGTKTVKILFGIFITAMGIFEFVKGIKTILAQKEK